MAHEGHGNHWECIFEDVGGAISRWLPEVLSRGRLVGPLRPDAAGLADGETVGIAYPDTPLRALALISGQDHDGTTENVFASGYPWAASGIPQRLILDEVLPWQGGIEAWLRTSFPGGDGPELTFFDTLFHAHRQRLELGAEAAFSLAGVAYSAEVAHPDPVVIDNPETIRAMRAGTDRADDTSPIEVRLNGAAVLLPRDEYAPHEYEFQGPVKAVEAFDLFGCRVMRLTITVARLLDHEDEDVDIALYVADHVWRTNERPLVGSDVRGLMWLQGHLAEADAP